MTKLIKEAVAKCIKIYGDFAKKQLEEDPDWDNIWTKIDDFSLFVKVICITLFKNEGFSGITYDCIAEYLKSEYVEEIPPERCFKITDCPNFKNKPVDLEHPSYLQLYLICQILDRNCGDLLKDFINSYFIVIFQPNTSPDNKESVCKFLNVHSMEQIKQAYMKYFDAFIGESILLGRDYIQLQTYSCSHETLNDQPRV